MSGDGCEEKDSSSAFIKHVTEDGALRLLTIQHECFQQQMLQQDLFWAKKNREFQMYQGVPEEFKKHTLPLLRIRNIMKMDEDANPTKVESRVLLAKACELLITDLTTRAWLHSEDRDSNIMSKEDIVNATGSTNMFDCFIDVLNPKTKNNINQTIKKVHATFDTPTVTPSTIVQELTNFYASHETPEDESRSFHEGKKRKKRKK